MLSNSSCSSRNWNRSMSQATWPASAMILRSCIGAMSPFFCSSKSRSSAKGKVALACCKHLQRELRWRLALGMEMPASGAVPPGRGPGFRRETKLPATAKAAPAAGSDPINWRRVVMTYSGLTTWQ